MNIRIQNSLQAHLIALYQEWLHTLKNKPDLSRADLSGANLSYANLSCADLSRANLSYANLSCADLSRANLSHANLSRADLSGANLSDANLSDANLSRPDLSGANLSANLSCADLSRADLSGANLSGANLSGANLSGANLSGANMAGIKGDYSIVPEKGAFIGFKKLRDNVIAELKIPAKAGRVGGMLGRKCRAEYVKVIHLSGNAKQGFDNYTGKCNYIVGKITRPDKWNSDIRKECTNGIHFFLTRKEAEQYE